MFDFLFALWKEGHGNTIQLLNQTQTRSKLNGISNDFKNVLRFASKVEELQEWSKLPINRGDKFACFEFIINKEHCLYESYKEIIKYLKQLSTGQTNDEIFENLREAFSKIYQMNGASTQEPFSGGILSLRISVFTAFNEALVGNWKSTIHVNDRKKLIKKVIGLLPQGFMVNDTMRRVYENFGSHSFNFEETRRLPNQTNIRDRTNYTPDEENPLEHIFGMSYQMLWLNEPNIASVRTFTVNIAALTMASNPSHWHLNAAWFNPSVIQGSYYFGFAKYFDYRNCVEAARVSDGGAFHLDCGSFYTADQGVGSNNGLIEGMMRQPFCFFSRGFGNILTFSQFALALACGAYELNKVQINDKRDSATSRDLFSPLQEEHGEAALRVPTFCWAVSRRGYEALKSDPNTAALDNDTLSLLLHNASLQFWSKRHQLNLPFGDEKDVCFETKDDLMAYETMFVNEVRQGLDDYKHGKFRELIKTRERLTASSDDNGERLAQIDSRSRKLSPIHFPTGERRGFDHQLDMVKSSIASASDASNDYRLIGGILDGVYGLDGCEEMCQLIPALTQLYNFLHIRCKNLLNKTEVGKFCIKDFLDYLRDRSESMADLGSKLFNDGIEAFNKVCKIVKDHGIAMGACGEHNEEKRWKPDPIESKTGAPLATFMTLNDQDANCLQRVVVEIVGLYNRTVEKLTHGNISGVEGPIDWSCVSDMSRLKPIFKEGIMLNATVDGINMIGLESYLSERVLNFLIPISTDKVNKELQSYEFASSVETDINGTTQELHSAELSRIGDFIESLETWFKDMNCSISDIKPLNLDIWQNAFHNMDLQRVRSVIKLLLALRDYTEELGENHVRSFNENHTNYFIDILLIKPVNHATDPNLEGWKLSERGLEDSSGRTILSPSQKEVITGLTSHQLYWVAVEIHKFVQFGWHNYGHESLEMKQLLSVEQLQNVRLAISKNKKNFCHKFLMAIIYVGDKIRESVSERSNIIRSNSKAKPGETKQIVPQDISSPELVKMLIDDEIDDDDNEEEIYDDLLELILSESDENSEAVHGSQLIHLQIILTNLSSIASLSSICEEFYDIFEGHSYSDTTSMELETALEHMELDDVVTLFTNLEAVLIDMKSIDIDYSASLFEVLSVYLMNKIRAEKETKVEYEIDENQEIVENFIRCGFEMQSSYSELLHASNANVNTTRRKRNTLILENGQVDAFLELGRCNSLLHILKEYLERCSISKDHLTIIMDHSSDNDDDDNDNDDINGYDDGYDGGYDDDNMGMEESKSVMNDENKNQFDNNDEYFETDSFLFTNYDNSEFNDNNNHNRNSITPVTITNTNNDIYTASSGPTNHYNKNNSHTSATNSFEVINNDNNSNNNNNNSSNNNRTASGQDFIPIIEADEYENMWGEKAEPPSTSNDMPTRHNSNPPISSYAGINMSPKQESFEKKENESTTWSLWDNTESTTTSLSPPSFPSNHNTISLFDSPPLSSQRVISSESVENIMRFGFPRELACEALTKFNGNENDATDWIFSQSERESRAQDRITQQSTSHHNYHQQQDSLFTSPVFSPAHQQQQTTHNRMAPNFSPEIDEFMAQRNEARRQDEYKWIF
eukprot:TRINITY_DN1237_c1_g2_i2.p1 TRINITY_DN1237_c1_g2~~TRINITY_DN1237_c1_g2_i2.p1  ORF type:complete len:1647 (+),score=479.83 TRINITY_DN1237_c1_g2_i2:151-4941(+)